MANTSFVLPIMIGTGGTLNLAGGLTVPATAAITWSTRSVMTSPADGQWLLTANAGAGNSAVSLLLGDTAATAVRLKRAASSTLLAVRLADDSADAGLTALTGVFSSTLQATTLNLTAAGHLKFEGVTVFDDDGASVYINPVANNGSVILYTNGSQRFQVDSTGKFILAAASPLTWSARAQIQSPADGIFLLENNAGTGFTGIKLGGTTASFPYIKVSGTTIAARLADDSADAPLTASNITASGALGVTGTSTLAAVTGTTGTFSGVLSTTATGSAGAPSLSLSTATNGLFAPAANQVAISTNGTQAALWDASQNLTVPAAAQYIWSGRAYLDSPADQQVRINKNNGGNLTTLVGGIVFGSQASLVYDSATGLRAMTANQGANLGFAGSSFMITNADGAIRLGTTTVGLAPNGSQCGIASGSQLFLNADASQNINFYGTGGSGGNNKSSTLNLKTVTANTTLSLASATTTLATIPAGALVVGVTARVTTAITAVVSTSWSLGTGAIANDFGSGLAFAAGTTVNGTNYVGFTGSQMYPSATALQAVLNVDAATAGAIRVVIWYFDTTAPTS